MRWVIHLYARGMCSSNHADGFGGVDLPEEGK